MELTDLEDVKRQAAEARRLKTQRRGGIRIDELSPFERERERRIEQQSLEQLRQLQQQIQQLPQTAIAPPPLLLQQQQQAPIPFVVQQQPPQQQLPRQVQVRQLSQTQTTGFQSRPQIILPVAAQLQSPPLKLPETTSGKQPAAQASQPQQHGGLQSEPPQLPIRLEKSCAQELVGPQHPLPPQPPPFTEEKEDDDDVEEEAGDQVEENENMDSDNSPRMPAHLEVSSDEGSDHPDAMDNDKEETKSCEKPSAV
jgi:hypothetical protein